MDQREDRNRSKGFNDGGEIQIFEPKRKRPSIQHNHHHHQQDSKDSDREEDKSENMKGPKFMGQPKHQKHNSVSLDHAEENNDIIWPTKKQKHPAKDQAIQKQQSDEVEIVWPAKRGFGMGNRKNSNMHASNGDDGEPGLDGDDDDS